jgi:hypothetical protein
MPHDRLLATDHGRIATVGCGRHRKLDRVRKAQVGKKEAPTEYVGFGSEGEVSGEGRVDVCVHTRRVGVRLYLLTQPLLSERHGGGKIKRERDRRNCHAVDAWNRTRTPFGWRCIQVMGCDLPDWGAGSGVGICFRRIWISGTGVSGQTLCCIW